MIIEHPTGHLDVTLRLRADGTPPDTIIGAGVVRTARPIMDGVVYLDQSRRQRPVDRVPCCRTARGITLVARPSFSSSLIS